MSQSTIFADTGNGATLTFGTTTYSVKIKSITLPSHSRDPLDASTLDTTGFEKSIQGDLTKRPMMKVSFLWDTFYAIPSLSSAPETVTVTFPQRTGESAAATYAGTAFFQNVQFPTLANGTVQEASMDICFDGGTGPTWTKSS